WEERAKIWKFHQVFLGGMTHFLRVDSSARADLKEKAKTIGFQRGSFDETQGWPHQLYVREARRMISRYVVMQKDLEGKSDPSDSVALASYGVDDWPYAMFPLNGKIALNGGMYSRVCLNEANRGIYKIPYRAITPRKEECENLIVPVCCSASHVAMTSIRMEPVWMMLGESAGVAASMAIQERSAVQEIGDVALREKLKERGQILERPT
ncbi:MAG: FAD-dependent oxidoreductase, partial [Verrucomicrobia bacterium]|nr:FAD-dependent oxidoreductase [Verrucomicrobiota bacterium]